MCRPRARRTRRDRHSSPPLGLPYDQLAFEHVGLFDLDVLVVRQNRAGREPHKCGYQAGLLVQKKTLYLATGKASFFPSRARLSPSGVPWTVS